MHLGPLKEVAQALPHRVAVFTVLVGVGAGAACSVLVQVQVQHVRCGTSEKEKESAMRDAMKDKGVCIRGVHYKLQSYFFQFPTK